MLMNAVAPELVKAPTPPVEANGANVPLEAGADESSFLDTLELAVRGTGEEPLPDGALAAEVSDLDLADPAPSSSLEGEEVADPHEPTTTLLVSTEVKTHPDLDSGDTPASRAEQPDSRQNSQEPAGMEHAKPTSEVAPPREGPPIDAGSRVQPQAQPSAGDANQRVEPSGPSLENSAQGESGLHERSDTPKGDVSRSAAPPQTAEATAPKIDPGVSAAPGSSAQATQAPAGELRALPELPVQNEAEILRQVRVLIQDGGGRARIQLHPPDLGGLNLRIVVLHDSVQLSVVADRGAVAELLARHLPELRQALEAQGLQLDQAEVDVHEQAESRTPDGAAEERARQRDRDEASLLPEIPSLLAEGRPVLRSLGTVDVRV